MAQVVALLLFVSPGPCASEHGTEPVLVVTRNELSTFEAQVILSQF